jgi:hypothetical protein
MGSPTEKRRARAISQLEKLREQFGPEAAHQRRTLLSTYARKRCRSARELESLHETLCFSRAYPDDEATLTLVDELLESFGERADVRAFSDELIGKGIAGVPTVYPFYWPTARWLAERWPAHLHVDWDVLEDPSRIEGILQLLMPRAESPGLEELDLGAREWLARLKRDDEGDGTFLARRFLDAGMNERWREHAFDSLDTPFVLTANKDTPSRTRACIPGLPVSFQREPRPAGRPDLQQELRRRPRKTRHVSRARGELFVDVAREAMLTRERDLEAIAYADPGDAWLIEDADDGLVFIALGMVPERRFVLEGTYVYLVVNNGVPVGYLQGSGLGGWAEVNFNVFPPWRGRDAGRLYARSLAVIRDFQRIDTFVVDPYQLGDGNDEAIESGAWWFYRKLGFEPMDPSAKKVAAREATRLAKDRAYRTSPQTLRELAASPMQLQVGKAPGFPYGYVGNVGLHASHALSVRGGGNRAEALATAREEAAKLLGTRDPCEGWSKTEREAFDRWAPLLVSMAALKRWSPGKKRSLLDVIRARGARHERTYIDALADAPEIVEALAKLARTPAPAPARKRRVA